MTGEILPYQEMETVVLSTAVRLNLPGSTGGLMDARPHMKKLLGELYANGYVLMALKGDNARAVAGTLNSGQRSSV